MDGARGTGGQLRGGRKGSTRWGYGSIGQLIYQTAHPANCRKNAGHVNRVMTDTRNQKQIPAGVKQRIVMVNKIDADYKYKISTRKD
tara:strand:+ start:178 stop:438 length:261 start_codon:yes stop_codon:yes gene_type:complete